MSLHDYVGATTCRSNRATPEDFKHNKLQAGANSSKLTLSSGWKQGWMIPFISCIHNDN